MLTVRDLKDNPVKLKPGKFYTRPMPTELVLYQTRSWNGKLGGRVIYVKNEPEQLIYVLKVSGVGKVTNKRIHTAFVMIGEHIGWMQFHRDWVWEPVDES